MFEALLIGTPKEPKPSMARMAAVHPHHSVHPSKMEVGMMDPTT
jgi:hypothetical protein